MAGIRKPYWDRNNRANRPKGGRPPVFPQDEKLQLVKIMVKWKPDFIKWRDEKLKYEKVPKRAKKSPDDVPPFKTLDDI